jgi:O-antigen/teichoic acid export membrane protein
MVVMVSAAANMVLMPVISRAWSENRRNDLLKKTMKALMYVQLIQLPVVAVLVLAPKWVIDTVYQGRYSENWPILAILGGLSLVRPFGSLFSTAGSAMGKPQYSFWSVLISAMVNVILNIVLIPRMGGQGAAWATAAAVFSGALTVVVLTLKRWKAGTEER